MQSTCFPFGGGQEFLSVPLSFVTALTGSVLERRLTNLQFWRRYKPIERLDVIAERRFGNVRTFIERFDAIASRPRSHICSTSPRQ